MTFLHLITHKSRPSVNYLAIVRLPYSIDFESFYYDHFCSLFNRSGFTRACCQTITIASEVSPHYLQRVGRCIPIFHLRRIIATSSRKLAHFRGQSQMAAVSFEIAKLCQGQNRPSDARAGLPRDLGDLGHGLLIRWRRERAQHIEAVCQGLDEIARLGVRSCHHGERLSAFLPNSGIVSRIR